MCVLGVPLRNSFYFAARQSRQRALRPRSANPNGWPAWARWMEIPLWFGTMFQKETRCFEQVNLTSLPCTCLVFRGLANFNRQKVYFWHVFGLLSAGRPGVPLAVSGGHVCPRTCSWSRHGVCATCFVCDRGFQTWNCTYNNLQASHVFGGCLQSHGSELCLGRPSSFSSLSYLRPFSSIACA